LKNDEELDFGLPFSPLPVQPAHPPLTHHPQAQSLRGQVYFLALSPLGSGLFFSIRKLLEPLEFTYCFHFQGSSSRPRHWDQVFLFEYFRLGSGLFFILFYERKPPTHGYFTPALRRKPAFFTETKPIDLTTHKRRIIHPGRKTVTLQTSMRKKSETHKTPVISMNNPG